MANPWLAWLGPAAEAVKAQRLTASADSPSRKLEELNAELISAGLDYYRATRDALAETAFFTTYGNIHLGYLAEQPVAQQAADDRFAELVGLSTCTSLGADVIGRRQGQQLAIPEGGVIAWMVISVPDQDVEADP